MHRRVRGCARQLSAGITRTQARLNELTGLEGPKEQIALWRTEIQIDQLLADQGVETSGTDENHIVLEGPPGTVKTTFARIAAEILFGLNKGPIGKALKAKDFDADVERASLGADGTDMSVAPWPKIKNLAEMAPLRRRSGMLSTASRRLTPVDWRIHDSATARLPAATTGRLWSPAATTGRLWSAAVAARGASTE